MSNNKSVGKSFRLNSNQGTMTPFEGKVSMKEQIETQAEDPVLTTPVEEVVVEDTPVIEETEVNTGDPFADRQPSIEDILNPDPEDIQRVEDEIVVEEKEEGKELEEEVVEEVKETEDPIKSDNENIFYHLGVELKEQNELPEDFEISEDISPEDIYKAYKSYLKDDIESEVINKTVAKLQEEGYNVNDLEYAKMFRRGVNPNTLSDLGRYEMIANFDTTEATAEQKQALVKEYYGDRNFTEVEMKSIFDRVELDEIDINDLVKESQKHFGSKANQIKTSEQEAASIREQQREDQYLQVRKGFETVVESGKALGIDIPNKKDLRKSIFDRTEQIQIGSQIYNVTELEAYMYEFENNPELKVAQFLKYKYKDEIDSQIKSDIEEKVEESFLSGYKKAVVKDTTKKKNLSKDIKKTIKKQEGNKKTLRFSFK